MSVVAEIKPVVVSPVEKKLAEALDMAVQSFGEYFDLKIGDELSERVRQEVAQALQRTLAGQMGQDIKDILRREVQKQIDALKSQIKVSVGLGE